LRIAGIRRREDRTIGIDEWELIDKVGKKRQHVNALLECQLWLMVAFGRDGESECVTTEVSPER
jgi:hypothetical protein